MKQKGLFKNLTGLSLALVLGLFVSSCGDDTKAPTIKLYVTTDGFTANIVAEASSDVTNWSWEYGDGETSDTIGTHEHTYATGGDFTIKCTVTNADGLSSSDDESITIATIEELLTSYDWVMSNAGNNGIGFQITPELTISFPASNVLASIDGLQDPNNDLNPDYDYTKKYDDVYTFNEDGTYEISNGGETMIGWVYGSINQVPDEDYVTTCRYIGINVVKNQPTTGAKWKLHENVNLKLNTVIADPDKPLSDGVEDVVNFENIDYIEFTEGVGFLGIKDLTPIVVIRSISSKELLVTLFYHGYIGDPVNDGGLYARPSFLFNITFKPASDPK
jgi:PKD repeat protein